MTFADLVYFAALTFVVIFSSVVLVREFLRGDLATRTTRSHPTFAPRISSRHRSAMRR